MNKDHWIGVVWGIWFMALICAIWNHFEGMWPIAVGAVVVATMITLLLVSLEPH